MKKLLSGLCALAGLLVLGAGLAVRVLPEESWGPIALLRIWWIPIVVIGALLLAAGLILLWVNRGGKAKEDMDSEAFVMSSNEDLRARVRDLLRRAWGRPLLALLLCGLPLIVAHAAVHLFLRPVQLLVEVFRTEIFGTLSTKELAMELLVILSGGALPDLSGLMAVVPGLAVLAVVVLFVLEPMLVSRSAYFLRLLRGRRPSPTEVYGVFGAGYGRALGGTAYRALWSFLWLLVAVGIPTGLYATGITLINAFPEAVSSQLLTLVSGLMVVFLVSLGVMACVWINRMLAYCMVPCVLATQQNLPARRALRASRKLMRGQKWRVLGLALSYLYYFIPAMVATAVLLALPWAGSILGFSEILNVSLRRFSWILIGANQLILVYVLPLAYGSFHAYYLERKRELQEGDPSMLEVLGIRPRRQD